MQPRGRRVLAILEQQGATRIAPGARNQLPSRRPDRKAGSTRAKSSTLGRRINAPSLDSTRTRARARTPARFPPRVACHASLTYVTASPRCRVRPIRSINESMTGADADTEQDVGADEPDSAESANLAKFLTPVVPRPKSGAPDAEADAPEIAPAEALAPQRTSIFDALLVPRRNSSLLPPPGDADATEAKSEASDGESIAR